MWAITPYVFNRDHSNLSCVQHVCGYLLEARPSNDFFANWQFFYWHVARITGQSVKEKRWFYTPSLTHFLRFRHVWAFQTPVSVRCFPTSAEEYVLVGSVSKCWSTPTWLARVILWEPEDSTSFNGFWTHGVVELSVTYEWNSLRTHTIFTC